MPLLNLLAQASDSNLGSGLVGGIFGAAGGVLFAIWYGWYTTTTTLPENLKAYREERALDRAERALERKAFEDAVEKLADAIRGPLHRGGT